MRKVRILVTGGAGYIGAHFVKNCYENANLSFTPEILIYDDLSRGLKSRILYGELEEAPLDDKQKLRTTIARFRPDIVVHFAAYIQVAESEEEPWLYFKNNTENTLSFLRILEDERVPYFIFSSTAAVYGQGEQNRPLLETDPFSAINVYGISKSMIDQILTRSMSKLPFNFLTFRYFNVCGADPKARIGQDTDGATHLITRALEAALGGLEYLPIYGNDYDTPDGTNIRDYIHVEDLVNAHILGMEWLLAGKASNIFNLGSGTGYSVKEVIKTVEEVIGHPLKVRQEKRRAGDPDIIIADPHKAETILHWKRQYGLLDMVRHAYLFQKGLK